VADVEKRGVRSGEVRRADFAESEGQVPIQCRGIAALAMHVNTVAGMKWRCNRCGAAVSVVHDVPEWIESSAPAITQQEAVVFMTLAQLMSDNAAH